MELNTRVDTHAGIRALIEEAIIQLNFTVDELAKAVARDSGTEMRTFVMAMTGNRCPQWKTWRALAKYLETKKGVEGISADVEKLIRHALNQKYSKSPVSIPTRESDPRHKYLGTWNSYRASLPQGADRPVIARRFWTVHEHYPDDYIVESRSKQDEKAGFKGSLLYERDFCIVRLQAIEHQEEILVRLHDPIPPHVERTFGLYLCMGYGHHSIAGPIAISRDEMSDDDLYWYWASVIRVVEDDEKRLLVLIDIDPEARK